MKLLEFEVKSPFRNLKGLKIKFDSNMSTYVIIGTNGAGKSNVLEALSSVFKNCIMILLEISNLISI